MVSRHIEVSAGQALPAGTAGQLDTAAAASSEGSCQTIEQVIDEMTRRWRVLHRKGDWRAVFAKTYLKTTEHLLAATHQSGTFLNPDWIVRIDCEFAQRYFSAIDCWDKGEACPWPWRVAFRSATRKQTLVFQDVLLGMNAHINYDLPFSLDATIPPDLSHAELAPYRRDHDQLNRILGQAVNLIQDEIADDYDPAAINTMDLVLGDVDEGCGSRMIRMWRERSWANFLLLRKTRDHQAERMGMEQSIEQNATDYAIMLLEIQRALPGVYWANRAYRECMCLLTRWRR